MGEEEKVDQEELAKEWEAQASASNQEDLASAWEESLNQDAQQKEQKDSQTSQEDLAATREKNSLEKETLKDASSQEDLASQWEQSISSDGTQNQEDLASAREESVSGEASNQHLASQWEQDTKTDTQQTEEKNIKRSDLEDFGKYEKSEHSKLSALLMDIPLEVSIEIGSTEMSLEEVLKLNPNSIIELDRMVSEPIDLKVNGKLIAQGELYTIKNNFGIKITNILTPEDRMKILNGE